MENKNLLPPQGNADVILDTDAYNEIDDQFAISYLLRNEDRLNCIGLCAAPFFNHRSSSPKDGMEKSYDEIKKLLKLLNREDVPVYKGSEDYLSDESTPRKSDAVSFITESAKRYSPEKPLYVLAIGAITNVASAVLTAPEIINNIVIVWLGGVAVQFDSSNEFNMIQDIAAARVAMTCGAPFVQLPCTGVVDIFHTNKFELEHYLFDVTPISDYLARNTVEYCDPDGDRGVWSKVIWDVTAVAWLLNDDNRFMHYEITEKRIPDYNKHLDKTVYGQKMCYVTSIRRDNLMADLFKKLTRK